MRARGCLCARHRQEPSVVDGNKRVAFVLARVFLGLNGVRFDPPEAEAVVMVEGLAGSQVREAEFVAWLRKHSK